MVKIGAILSNDPERIKIYTDGFDGHSIRSLKYHPEKMPDIVEKVDKAKTATKKPAVKKESATKKTTTAKKTAK